MGAIVGITVIEEGPRLDALVKCLSEKFPERSGLRDSHLIEVHILDDTTGPDLWDQVRGALGECDERWEQIVRMPERPKR